MSVRFVLIALLLLCASCHPEPEADLDHEAPASPAVSSLSAPVDTVAERLISQAREAHNSSRLDSATVRFRFRTYDFEVLREDGRFRYVRTATDSLGRHIADVLSNDGVSRAIDGQASVLTDAQRLGIEGGINSVVYFALLPYALTDPAVKLRYLGPDSLRGEPYEAVEVTFRQEGGGRDWDDRFIYWLHRDRHTLDYLAYTFHVNGGGTRFREAYNIREVEGIRFADYRNFTAPGIGDTLEAYGRPPVDLELLSTVELENVEVQR